MKAPIPTWSLAASLLLAAPLGAGAAPPAAPATSEAPAADDHAALERKLEDARARLEKAAKEVAELSVGLMPDMESIHMMIDGHPHPMLGVRLGEAKPGGGVAIAGVSPGSAAAEAGFQSGDVIISVNGRKISNAKEVSEELHKAAPGAQLKIERSRAGALATVAVTPRPVDPRIQLLLDDHGRGMHDLEIGMHDLMVHAMPGMEGGWGELELAALSPDLGRYFGTDKGVLVVKASPGFSDKLRDGDVILSIGEREAHTASQALRILRSYEPRDHVTLAIERDHKPQKLEIVMPDRMPHPQPAPHPLLAPHAPPAPPAPAAPAAPAAPTAPAAPAAPSGPAAPGTSTL